MDGCGHASLLRHTEVAREGWRALLRAWSRVERPQDWPDELAAVVLAAIRRAPEINDDPLIRNLRDTGRP